MNAPEPDTGTTAYWKNRWQELQGRSLLRQTQVAGPERWNAFYNSVAGLWGRLAGIGPGTGAALANEIMGAGLAGPGDSLLELGCGPGSLSIALARKGLEVTALDRSRAMIQRVTAKAAAAGSLSLAARMCDWTALPLEPAHDIVLAACFPDAFSPDGISRMEALGKKRCILVLGRGKETFPLRRRIWEAVMDVPCPLPRFHLECAPAYLKAAGRDPGILNCDFPVTLAADVDEITTYFTAYFKLFGLGEARVGPVVQKVVAPFSNGGRVTVSGEVSLAVIAWRPDSDIRGSRKHG